MNIEESLNKLIPISIDSINEKIHAVLLDHHKRKMLHSSIAYQKSLITGFEAIDYEIDELIKKLIGTGIKKDDWDKTVRNSLENFITTCSNRIINVLDKKGFDTQKSLDINMFDKHRNHSFEELNIKIEKQKESASQETNYQDIKKKDLSEKMNKVFISHSSKDKEIVGLLIDLLEDIGLSNKTIFCSTFEGYSIPLGKDFLSYIKKELDSSTFVIFMLSENFYDSSFCLCEMGAAWVKTESNIPIIIPPMDYQKVEGTIKNIQSMIINDKYKLNSLKDQLIRLFSLEELNNNVWERKRDKFIEEINSLLKDESPSEILEGKPTNKVSNHMLKFFKWLKETKPDLNRFINRQEAIALTIGAIGKDAEALALSSQEISTQLTLIEDDDHISTWAKPYVAYAIKTGLVKNVDKSSFPYIKFGAQFPIGGKEFISFMLKAMGYMVAWDDVLIKATEIGIFPVGDVVTFGTTEMITYQVAAVILVGVLSGTLPDGRILAQRLLGDGILTKEDLLVIRSWK